MAIRIADAALVDATKIINQALAKYADYENWDEDDLFDKDTPLRQRIWLNRSHGYDIAREALRGKG